ncbi:hypothetical protein [Lentzea guizhouensis]|uniref:hypothetical protein n=1 Tax=Lentzea guizhouensis TaxID=1586287 RepID=UPI0014738C6A|nr:hypothetical protein [Lentzea guizhouensis]
MHRERRLAHAADARDRRDDDRTRGVSEQLVECGQLGVAPGEVGDVRRQLPRRRNGRRGVQVDLVTLDDRSGVTVHDVASEVTRHGA